jgi:hypothetical protein
MTVPDQPGGGWGGSKLRADYPPEVGPFCSPITNEQFKKWDCDKSGQRMGWGAIRKYYKRDMKYELIHTPKQLFEVGARYLQKRIEDTRLGKMKRGQRLYSSFQDFDAQASNKEGLPA